MDEQQFDPKQHAELMQRITSHPEFSGLLHTIVTNQMAQAQQAGSQIPNPQGQPPMPSPAPKVPMAVDPFSNRVAGKDQSRVPQGVYGTPPGPRSDAEDALGVQKVASDATEFPVEGGQQYAMMDERERKNMGRPPMLDIPGGGSGSFKPGPAVQRQIEDLHAFKNKNFGRNMTDSELVTPLKVRAGQLSRSITARNKIDPDAPNPLREELRQLKEYLRRVDK